MKISEVFQQLEKEGKKAFIPFIMAGDPSMDVTKATALALERAGANILELGMPFSDPVADGPTIQAAAERALSKGITLPQILEGVLELNQSLTIPVVLMGYYNPILNMGVDKFIEKAVLAGVAGMIVADLPPEEGEEWSKSLKKAGIDPIFLLTPFSGPQRWALVESLSSGMVYYVSHAGVTGSAIMRVETLLKELDQLKSAIKLPLVVGFGVREKKDVKALASHCDGVVVGSAIVDRMSRGDDVETYVKQLIK